MIGWLFTFVAGIPVIRTTCGGCRGLITVSTATVASLDGMLVCPNCGEIEVADRSRCQTIERVLRRSREGEQVSLMSSDIFMDAEMGQDLLEGK